MRNARGVLSAFVFASSLTILSPAQAANINLAVASNFYISGSVGSSPIADIIAGFTAANPGNTVTVVQNGATGTLENQIISGNSLNVDLFLAADTAHPQDLYTAHSSLVVGTVFTYAVGTLAFWSNKSGVDVTCNPGGSCGYNSTTYPKVAIADPINAPYGTAANTLLTGRYTLTQPLSSNPLVNIYSNIDLTYQAVNTGSETVGFVALSQLCRNGSYPQTGSVLVYPPTDTSHSPVIYNYSPINQGGIRIARSRSIPENTELNAFVAYLLDHTASPPSQMVTTLVNYCYGIP
ncbi:molybdate ABC transporter substrate-binding protein [Microbacteriaceae bacterium K1510]|nr:molybdate ABC transporter substrate-binding protein [Microbacteriaceae bacterium K1510]